MLEIHIDPKCDRCRQIEQGVREAGLAHAVVQADGQGNRGHELVDEGRTIKGHEFMQKHLSEYLHEAKLRHRFTGDYCYSWEDDESGVEE